MFNWTGHHIINSAVDENSGTPRWVAQDAQGGKPARFIVKRMGQFTSESVKGIYKTAYSPKVAGKVVITMKKGDFDLEKSGSGSYVLDLYVRLSGQNLDSRFANPYVLKGQPFTYSIEVTDDDTTATMAQKFANVINKSGVLYGDYRLKATYSGNDLTIMAGEVGLEEFLLFEKVDLKQMDERQPNPVRRTYKSVNATKAVTKPAQAFGDYDWIIRNYILPTTEHRNIWSVHELDQPILNGHYNAYVIDICNEVGVQGMDHVGDLVNARTQHVFYVLDSLATEWEAALAKVGTVQAVAFSITGRSGESGKSAGNKTNNETIDSAEAGE